MLQTPKEGKSRQQARGKMKAKFPLLVNKNTLVHHKNRNPMDNTFKNLNILTKKEHYLEHGQNDGWKGHNSKRTHGLWLSSLESLFYLYNEGIFIDTFSKFK